jgi:hypothetical protein
MQKQHFVENVTIFSAFHFDKVPHQKFTAKRLNEALHFDNLKKKIIDLNRQKQRFVEKLVIFRAFHFDKVPIKKNGAIVTDAPP